MSRPLRCLILMLSLLLGTPPRLPAQEPNPLRDKLKDTAADTSWIYDDIDKGFAEAKRTGKPMLVVFR
jgi:hypothetical protein